MRLLLLGCTGFVGRELVPLLLEGGHQLSLVSRRLPRGFETERADGRVEWLMVNVAPEGPWLVAASVALAGAGVVWGLHVLGRQTNASS